MRNAIEWMILAVALMGGVGCSRGPVNAASAPGNETTKIETAPDESIVEVEHPEQFVLTQVDTQKTAEEITANGAVAADVSRTLPVNAMTGGRVTEVHARLGDAVTKGQLLMKMVSQDLAAAIADSRKFKTDEVLARRQLERAKLLFSRGAIAEKDVQAAEDVDEKARIDVESTDQRIRVLGGDPQAPSPVIEIRSPGTGVIVEQNVTTAAGVKSMDNSPNLFTIADLSRVWILCDVYENNLAQVHMGDLAEVKLNAYPDKVLRGQVSNISRVLDPATRTVKVRLEMDNAAGLLRPGMFAVATFRSQVTKQRPVAPMSAFLRLHDRDWVFVPLGEKRFRRVEVTTGNQLADGRQEVLSGLQTGDRVVAEALKLSTGGAN